LLTTGNSLFGATLFTPWNGDSPSGGYGDDSDGSFPGYGTDGRLQTITAGVNAHAPDGYTATLELKNDKMPEGIRFERNDGHATGDPAPDWAGQPGNVWTSDGAGFPLKSIEIVSVTFSHSGYTVPVPEPPLTIDLTTAGNAGLCEMDVTGADYAGISFKLIDQLAGAGYRIGNFDQITFVTEVYDDVAGTSLITTGNDLYTAYLFKPWNDSSPSGGYGDDKDGSFPGWSATPNPEGRQQSITAGVNANAPNGLTTAFGPGVTTMPQGIRFEKNGAGSTLKYIKVISITFSHSEYGALPTETNLPLYTTDGTGNKVAWAPTSQHGDFGPVATYAYDESTEKLTLTFGPTFGTNNRQSIFIPLLQEQSNKIHKLFTAGKTIKATITGAWTSGGSDFRLAIFGPEPSVNANWNYSSFVTAFTSGTAFELSATANIGSAPKYFMIQVMNAESSELELESIVFDFGD